MTDIKYIKQNAMVFVGMAKTYASRQAYKKGWVYSIYRKKYTVPPLSYEEFNTAVRQTPNAEFKRWVRQQHNTAFKNKDYKPQQRVDPKRDEPLSKTEYN